MIEAPKKGKPEIQTEKYVRTPEGIKLVQLSPEEIEEEREKLEGSEKVKREEATRYVQDHILEVIF